MFLPIRANILGLAFSIPGEGCKYSVNSTALYQFSNAGAIKVELLPLKRAHGK